jgi:DNA-binding LytR/AlgR family response regulator
MTINCVIIDDEPLAVDLIKGYVERTPILHLCGTYYNAVEALPMLNEKSVDLLFLDINMPDINGLEFAKLISKDIRIIYTTAYSECAIDSYRVHALDYLLKPISYNCFLESIEKAIMYFQMIKGKRDIHTQDNKEEDEDSLFVKSEHKLIRISKRDIIFVEGLKDYIKIYTTTQPRPILTLSAMNAIEERLNTANFIRVHRSYVVNMQHANHYEKGKIILGKYEIQVSESGKEKLKAYINQRLVNK